MNATEFLKKWKGLSGDNKHATHVYFKTMLKFAEDYHKELSKKELKQVFDAYGIGFMGRAQFKHDFESWYEMESKNF